MARATCDRFGWGGANELSYVAPYRPRYREQFERLDIGDIKRTLFFNGARVRKPRFSPDYKFDVKRSEYDQAGLVIHYRGELEVRWKGKGRARVPRFFCGTCPAMVTRMYRRRFYWLCLDCLEAEVGKLRNLSQARRNLDWADLGCQAARLRCGIVTGWLGRPPVGTAPHLTMEASMEATEQWETANFHRNKLWCAIAKSFLGW